MIKSVTVSRYRCVRRQQRVEVAGERGRWQRLRWFFGRGFETELEPFALRKADGTEVRLTRERMPHEQEGRVYASSPRRERLA